MLSTPQESALDEHNIINCNRPPAFHLRNWDNIRPVPVEPKIADIVKAASEVFGVTVEDIQSASRERIYAWPRQVAMHVARKITRASLPMIGYYIGKRSHRTVMHADSVIRARLVSDPGTWVKTVETVTERAQELAQQRARETAK